MRLTVRSWKRSSLEQITVKLEDAVREREFVIVDRESERGKTNGCGEEEQTIGGN